MKKKATDHLGNEYPTIKSMCDAYGVDYDVYYMRIRLGMSVEHALTGNFIEHHKEFEKAEKRRIAFSEKNNGTPLIFPLSINLSDVKVESYYERKSGIYTITNKTNGKVYVGQALHIYERLYEHKIDMFYKDKNYNNLLKVALRNEGIENFECKVITAYAPNTSGIRDILNDEEQKFISEFNSFAPNGYNMTIGGQGTAKFEFSEEELKSLIEDYKNGMQIKDMTSKYGMCRETVRSILRSNDVPVRPAFSTERDPLICSMYEELHSIREVARRTGFSYDQVQTSLHRNNVEMQNVRTKKNEVYEELRQYYPLLAPYKDEIFEKFRNGVSLKKLDDYYFKYIKVKPKTRQTVERLLKSYLIEIGGFDVVKAKTPKLETVYMLDSPGDEGKVLNHFDNAMVAARYLSGKLGKTAEQCRSSISAVLSENTTSVSAYGFGFTRVITPEQALNYVLGTKKSWFTRTYGEGAFEEMLSEYDAIGGMRKPFDYFTKRIAELDELKKLYG